MRILLVTETLAAGGAEAFIVRLANALTASHEVTIAVLHGEMVHPSLLARLDQRVRLDRLSLPAKRLIFKADTALRHAGLDLPLLHLLQKRWLRRIVERDRPSIIHSHLLKADRLASELSGDGDQPSHVVTMHGDYAPFLHGQADPQMLSVERRIASIVSGAAAVVGVSADQLAYFAARYPAAARKLHLIYNGYAPLDVDPARASKTALGLPATDFTFGMVSRGVAQKGWNKAVAAFEALARPRTTLVLVGEGPWFDENRDALPANVIPAGFSSNPIEYIRHFDVGLLPTLFPHESLPTVIIEYLSAGKPVIATDVGEIGAMVRAPNGELAGTLLTFDNDDVSVAELAAAMQRMIDDPELRRRQSELASQAFEKFDLTECVSRYVRLYEDVVAGRSSNSSISLSH